MVQSTLTDEWGIIMDLRAVSMQCFMPAGQQAWWNMPGRLIGDSSGALDCISYSCICDTPYHRGARYASTNLTGLMHCILPILPWGEHPVTPHHCTGCLPWTWDLFVRRRVLSEVSVILESIGRFVYVPGYDRSILSWCTCSAKKR